MTRIRRYQLSCAFCFAVLFSAHRVLAQANSESKLRLGQSTPQRVLDASARFISHYSPEQKVRVVFGIRPPHREEEEQFLEELQDPSSPQFHRFLTPDEWSARFAPSAEDEQAVVDWAQAQGLTITKRYSHRLVVHTEGTVATIEKAFGIAINSYQDQSGAFFSNDRDPSLPARLAGIVESVGGLNNAHVFHSAVAARSKSRAMPSYMPGPIAVDGPSARFDYSGKSNSKPAVSPNITDGAYDPSDLKKSTFYSFGALFNLGHCCNPLNNPSQSPKETSIAIVTVGDFANNDLGAFAQAYGLSPNVQRVQVGGQPFCCEAETTLDVEWSAAMADGGSLANSATVRVYEGINEDNTTFTTLFTQVLDDNLTRVMTTSWGGAEQYDADANTMRTQSAIFSQMVGEGWTLIAASGDQGATADCSHVSVNYPASDPHVIAAGGTQLLSGPMYGSEVAWSGNTAPGSCAVNQGGSTGGCSSVTDTTIWTTPAYLTNAACTGGTRSVPDIALNASQSTPQAYYSGGSWQTVAGTSIVAPELAGFFAQENAYLLYIGSVVGNTCNGGHSACAPLGDPHPALYAEGVNKTAPHYPFYDITSGCNSNDVTAAAGLKSYCAAAGYDLVTGWGSANMLQLAWAFNDYMAGDNGPPSVAFSGPTLNTYYNTNQTVSWTITDTSGNGHPANGVAGDTFGWDSITPDATSEATPGSGNSFYSGPQTPNAKTGSLNLASVGQGCHTAQVQAWDNSGRTAGISTYGPICYDTIPPVTTASVQGNTVTLSATDSGSGVAKTVYAMNGGSLITYSAPFVVPSNSTVTFYSTDKAGNVESVNTIAVTGGSPSAALTFSPPSLTFGNQAVNITSAPQSVTVTNNGNTAVTISSIVASSGFSVNNTCNGSVAGNGGNCTITATFTPTTTGSVNGAITITDSASGSPQTIPLSGSTGSGSALKFVAITPCRVVDTRSGQGFTGAYGPPELGAGSVRNFYIPGSTCGIPSQAVAYSLNVTVVPDTELGYLSMWPTGEAQPSVSTLNSDGRIKANAAIVPGGTGGNQGNVTVFATDSTQLILDIDGYFVPAGTSGALDFYPLTPCRVADTRWAAGVVGGPSLAASTVRSFPVLSSPCGIPSTAQAYSLNFTAVPKTKLQYLTVWPTGETQPTVSTLNATTGTVTANAAIVSAGSEGAVSTYVSDSADLVIDVNGYFAPPGTGGLSLYTLTPCRVLDTRDPPSYNGSPFEGTTPVNVSSSICGVPLTAQAYVLNATVAPPGALGYLTLWPNGTSLPLVSTLNAIDGAVTSNMAIVPTTNGVVDAYASNLSQLILDVSSYFAP